MPNDYPENPPKATFKTRIYHPNVEETTGAVCLETLKRDWDPKLTLKDILVTISCLLIQPNPDSALNAAAGALIQEDYEAFAKQARLMTSIHAPIPRYMTKAVQDAKRRGEDREETALQSLHLATSESQSEGLPISEPTSISNTEDQCTKENDTARLSMRVPRPSSPRKSSLGKRPLAEVPSPLDADGEYQRLSSIGGPMPASEANIMNNRSSISPQDAPHQPLTKSPKLVRPDQSQTAAGKGVAEGVRNSSRGNDTEKEKENLNGVYARASTQGLKTGVRTSAPPAPRSSLRKVSNIGAERGKTGQPRVGIRRL